MKRLLFAGIAIIATAPLLAAVVSSDLPPRILLVAGGQGHETRSLEALDVDFRLVSPGDVAAGREFYKKECASCHGQDGYGDDSKHIPQLAGQYSQYLLKQVKDIRTGDRFHDDPDDAGVFREYAEAEIAAMLAYLATLDDG